MLTIPGNTSQFCDGLRRRDFLSIGALGLGGLNLPQLLKAESNSQRPRGHKAVIMVLLPGGPSHLDMYDLKPNAPTEIRGEFQPIASQVPGIEICELMPRLAARMKKFSVIRSLVGARNDHNIHQCVTGWETHPAQPASSEIPGYPPGGWPSLGAVLSRTLGQTQTGVPASVDLTPVYYDARFVTSAAPGQAGYLGPAHAGFEVRGVDRKNFELNGVSIDRLRDRRSLLSSFDQFRRRADAAVDDSIDTFQSQAMSMLTSSRLAHAIDLSREDDKTLAKFGLNSTGTTADPASRLLDQFLLARRVVEAGARYVTLCFSRYPFGRMSKGDYNWDWHRDCFGECRATLPLLDHGVSALVDDLDLRGMLDDVAVVVWGEFGRTPKINRDAGRDHWPQVASALIAGGGMQSGQVIGATNRFGENVKSRPVHFREVFATLYAKMGIDVANTQFHDLAGRPQYLVDGRDPIPELM